MKAFSRLLQRYVSLVAAVTAIALYAVLVGAEPPVVRAALMGGLAAVALIAGRKSDALTSLLVAAWVMTAWQPFVLWEIGFQLSFAATLGWILYSARLGRWVETALGRLFSPETAVRLTRPLSDTVLVTLAAQVTALPLMLVYFRQFSPLSLLANLLIMPVQPAVMYLGSTAAMLGLASIRLGQLVGWAAWLFLTYTIRVVELLANWIGTSGAMGNVHPIVPMAYYGLLALFTLDSTPNWFSPQAVWRRLRTGTAYKAALAALVAALVLVWVAVASLPDGRLHVAFLDVGQGDAIWVQTPAGHRLLIDGGPNPDRLLEALGRRLPFWDRRIDLVILSHPHEDHLLGLLTLVQRYQVRQVLMAEAQDASAASEQWQQTLQDRAIPVITVVCPLQVDLGDEVSMQILPTEADESGYAEQTWLVGRLTWQSTSFLFAGDLEAADLLELHDAGFALDCTVLKVPHHGSIASVNQELLAAVQPAWAMISVGADNRFGHPAEETLVQLEQAGVQVLRTDQAGTIDVISDGKQYWVRRQKGEAVGN